MIADAAFEPAKRELTPKQQRFVDAYIANGGQQTEAARTAGYGERSADVSASRLIRNPLVQQAILRATQKRIGLAAVPALQQVERLSSGARSEYVRLEASRDLLDRAGFKPPERVDHRIDEHLTVHIDLS